MKCSHKNTKSINIKTRLSVLTLKCLDCGMAKSKKFDWVRIGDEIPDTLETYKCMAISTAHLTYGMTERLEHLCNYDCETNILYRTYGIFIKLYSYDQEKNNKDYEYFKKDTHNANVWKRIIDFAIEHNFQMIEFDRDAEILDIFPKFEW